MNACADPIHGSCLCGGVRIRVTRPVIAMGNCHCSMCRRQHGTAFSTYAQVAREQLEIEQGEELVADYASSADVERSFCATCGSKLFYRSSSLPEYVWIAAGLFDDDPGIESGYHIFVGSKAPWFDIADDLPQHEAFPAGNEH
ncbi:MAG: GFA family protein [Gammaproteobacteria bacterium]